MSTTEAEEKFYSIAEAAEILGCAVQTVYDHRTKKTPFGQLFRYRGLGRRPVISEKDLFNVRDNGWK